MNPISYVERMLDADPDYDPFETEDEFLDRVMSDPEFMAHLNARLDDIERRIKDGTMRWYSNEEVKRHLIERGVDFCDAPSEP